MKIPFLKLLIFIAIALSTFNANAQSDRIITNSDDTIPCKIDGQNMLGAYKYSSGGGDHQVIITDANIKEFYNAFKTLWFRRVVFDNHKKIFMKVVLSGKISIYENVNGFRRVAWYASKNSDTAIFIQYNSTRPSDKRRKLFGNYLQDKKAVYEQYIEIKDPDMDDMLRLAQLYNIDEHLK